MLPTVSVQLRDAGPADSVTHARTCRDWAEKQREREIDFDGEKERKRRRGRAEAL